MTDTLWSGISPAAITGFGLGSPDGGSGGMTTGVDGAVGTAAGAHPPLYSPDNPLFWVGLLLLAGFGLVHISTSFKAGPASGSASV